MQIIMLLFYAIVVFSLTMFSSMLPFFAFLVSKYKIKHVYYDIKIAILFNIVVLVFMYIFMPTHIIYYLLLPLYLELWYIISLSFGYYCNLNNMVLGSIILSIIISALFYMFRVELNEIVLKTLQYYAENRNFNLEDILNAYANLKRYFIYFIFFIVFINMIMLNISINKSQYKIWSLSPFWLLLFCIPVLVSRFVGGNELIYENLIKIARIIFVVFGVSSFFKFIESTKSKSLTRFSTVYLFLTIILANMYPFITFIYGVYKSFNINIKIIKIGGK